MWGKGKEQMKETRKCQECGEAYTDTGDNECPFCGSTHTEIEEEAR